MAKIFRFPGFYIRETPGLPPSVAEVESAVPVFIGYSEKDFHNGMSLKSMPVKINLLSEFEAIFGMAEPAAFRTSGDDGIRIKKVNNTFQLEGSLSDPFLSLQFRLYYAVALYFANGGGPCFVCSCGSYSTGMSKADMSEALNAIGNEDGPTLIVFTDVAALSDSDDAYALYVDALRQCAELADRMVLVDVLPDKVHMGNAPFDLIKDDFRTKIGNSNLRYGAAYYPWLKTILDYRLDEQSVKVIRGSGVSSEEIPDNTVLRKDPAGDDNEAASAVSSLYHLQPAIYSLIKNAIAGFKVIMPPSPAIAGVYVMVDNTWGVWKSPANVSLSYVKELMTDISNREQQEMNVSVTGKSVNAIRNFTGRGILVWGARTLAGNDNEWRYVSVRRFCTTVEVSLKKALALFVHEKNEAQTWVKIKAMTESYLTTKWREGALQGNTPVNAFYVRVGLGETMTTNDVMDGRVILEFGLALMRPSEFIVVRIHQMIVGT